MRAWFALMLVFFPSLLWAQVPDYDLDDTAWLGMSELREVANAQGAAFEIVTDLDVSTLAVDEPLLIVYPTTPLDVANLSAFVVAGGRILLLDDFGESDSLLRRLELTRVIPSPGNLPHDAFLRDNPSLPVLRPSGRHPLLEGVEVLVANHPAVLDNSGGAVVPFAAGGALVYDMNLGDGKVVVVADPSVGINKMLGVGDNRRFMGNAIRYICGARKPCRVKFLSKDFATHGRYDGSPFASEDALNVVSGLNEAIQELVEHLPGSELFYYLGLLLGAGLVVYLFTIYPIRRTRLYSAYVTDFLDAVPAPQSEFDWNVSRFGRGSRTMNHALPMAILKETFEELFLADLGLWPSNSDERKSVEHLLTVFAERHMSHLSRVGKKKILSDTRDLLTVLARVPTRSRVFLEGDVQVTDAELLKYHAHAMRVLDVMGLRDEYDNRVRGAF